MTLYRTALAIFAMAMVAQGFAPSLHVREQTQTVQLSTTSNVPHFLDIDDSEEQVTSMPSTAYKQDDS